MLVHICCSVDSFYYIKRLKEKYPDKKMVGFFYDPNIHPYSEYYLRMIDAKRSCQKLGVEFIEGEYDVNGWLAAVRGLEDEPEKGKRCTVCFDNRLEESAKKAVELGFDEVTTTLLMSPKKDFSTLLKVSKELEQKYKIRFVAEDFRKNGGTQEQFAMSKEELAYHQNYCGCMFALKEQRRTQEKTASELYSPINNATLPGSIEERVQLYEKRISLEETGVKYRIVKERFFNYRILNAYVKASNEIVPSFFLPYSKTHRKRTKAKIDFFHEGMAFLNKECIVVAGLKKFNEVLGLDIKSVKELLFLDIPFKTMCGFRERVFDSGYGTGCIIVVDEIADGPYEIYLDAWLYEDTREVLAVFG